jgi:hypothetical protein
VTKIPTLPHLVGKFLYLQQFLDAIDSPNNMPIARLPAADPRSFHVFHSAVAEYYALSDHSGDGGCRHERIRAVPSWQNQQSRQDCLFVSKDMTVPGMAGMEVARAILFLSFTFKGQRIPCVLVEWFTTRREQCPCTGMWIVDQDYKRNGSRSTELIHLDSVIWGAHLIPVFCEGFVSTDLTYEDSLDRYDTFYVNQYADHHMFETIHV